MRVALTGHRPQRLGLPDSGGVWSTIRKAQKAGKKIIYCPKEILREV